MIIHLMMYPGITITQLSTLYCLIQVVNRLLAENPIAQELSFTGSRDSFEEYSSFLVMEKFPVNGHERWM